MWHRLFLVSLAIALTGCIASPQSADKRPQPSPAVPANTINDREAATQRLQELAERGNADAQYRLGQAYYFGSGVSMSSFFAYRWTLAAAEQGHAAAQDQVGSMCQLGISAACRSQEKAFEWYRRAAEQGNPEGQFHLGDAYRVGRGVKSDYVQAYVWLSRAISSATEPSTRRRASEARNDLALKMSSQQIAEAGMRWSPPPQPAPADIYSRLTPSVFRLLAMNAGKQDMSQGSAVAVGMITAITNCHVIEGMSAIGAKIDNNIVLFKRHLSDPTKDICVLIPDFPLKPGGGTRRFEELRVGEKVYALGSPQSLENTMSEGIISGLRTINGVRHIQTSAPISPGSSGGGLFDENGRLIGITTFKVRSGENLNFAVAIDEALSMAGQLP